MSGDFDTELAHDDFGADARTLNFDTGASNLTAITAAPASSQTPAQLAAAARAAQGEKIAAIGVQTAQLKQTGGYDASRAQDQADNQAFMNYIATVPSISKARIDWGLIPAGAAILTTGAALIASGGALAGALAAPLSASAAGGAAAAVSTAAAADKLLATVQQGGKIAAAAADVIDNTKKLAAAGNTDAQQALGIVEGVAKDRIAKAVPAGVLQPLSDAGKLAAETVPVVVAVKGDVQDLAKAIGAVVPKGSAPSSAPATSSPAVALPPTPALDVTLSAAGQRATPALPSVSSAALAKRPRWVVTDDALVFLAATQPESARGRYLVYDDGRVIHQ